MSETDINKVLAQAKTFNIDGMDVKIKQLDFEDTMKLSQCKQVMINGEKRIDMSDENTQTNFKNLIIKKLKQSFTKIKENGEKIIPSDDDINNMDTKFITKYMSKIFEMNKGDSKK